LKSFGNVGALSSLAPGQKLALALFVPGIVADHPHNALALDDRALNANLFHAGPYFHVEYLFYKKRTKLFFPVHYPALAQVVGRKFKADFIAGQYLDVMDTHFSGNNTEYHLARGNFHPESGVGQGLFYYAFNFYFFAVF